MGHHEYQGPDAHYYGTDAYPNRYVSPAAQVADEDHRDDVAYFVGRGDQAGQARRYLKALFYSCYHRIYVSRTQRLL